jgi:hypothetical protein
MPGPDDLEHLGYGPWLRESDQQIINRYLDLRELTPLNQHLFRVGAQRAYTRFVKKQNSQIPEDCAPSLRRLLTMLKYVQLGRPPDELSDWVKGYTTPPTGNRVGPGW